MFSRAEPLRAAMNYVRRSKVLAEIARYEKIASERPGDLNAINTLGDLHARAGNIAEATRHYSYVGESYRWEGFRVKAIATFKKILKLDQGNLDALMTLAELYVEQNLAGEARPLCLQAAEAYAHAGEWQKAVTAYELLLRLAPSDMAACMRLGEFCHRSGLPERAVEVYVAAGVEWWRHGEGEQALDAYARALAIKPDHSPALAGILNVKAEQGRAAEAIEIIGPAVERRPDDAEVLGVYGSACLAAGLLDEAERVFSRLALLDRRQARRLLDVGDVLMKRGDLERAVAQVDGCLDALLAEGAWGEAIAFLRRVLQAESDHLGALKRLSHIFLQIAEVHQYKVALKALAASALRRNNRPEAAAALKQLADLEPDVRSHRQRLAALAGCAVAPQQAASAAPREAFMNGPRDEAILKHLFHADVLARRGELEPAMRVLKELLRHTPDNELAHRRLKALYLRAGRVDLATSQSLQLARLRSERAARQSEPPHAEGIGSELAARNEVFAAAGFGREASAGGNRRKAPRTALRLPTLVNRQGEWCEFAECLDLSRLGMRLEFNRRVERGATLRVQLPMLTRTAGHRGEQLLSRNGVVRHVAYCKGDNQLVGVEFALHGGD